MREEVRFLVLSQTLELVQEQELEKAQGHLVFHRDQRYHRGPGCCACQSKQLEGELVLTYMTALAK